MSSGIWRNWLSPPPLRWWFEPSGGDVNPPPWQWWQWLIESPVMAHGVHAWWRVGLSMLVIAFVPWPWNAGAMAAVLTAYGQGQKGDALVPLHRYNMRNVWWRFWLGTAGAALWTWIYSMLFGG